MLVKAAHNPTQPGEIRHFSNKVVLTSHAFARNSNLNQNIESVQQKLQSVLSGSKYNKENKHKLKWYK